MHVILIIVCAIILGAMAFLAYAMVFTVLLALGVLLALVTLLAFGLEHAQRGEYGLLVLAALVWVAALAALLAVRRAK